MNPRHQDLRRRRPWAACICLWLLASLSLAGCGAEETGEFTLSGFQRYGECLSKASPIRPSSFTSRDAPGDTIGLFFQTDYRLPSTSDTVYLQIYQTDYVRQHLGEPIELSNPTELVYGDQRFDQPPIVRGLIQFEQTCPKIKETFALLGTVVFDEIGAHNGDIVSGRLVDGQVISLRDLSVVADNISGSWQFTVSERRPHQYFPTFGSGVPRGPSP